jgi:hypothetical protein
VSAVALVMETNTETAAEVDEAPVGGADGAGPDDA